MKYKIIPTSRFKKDLKRIAKNHFDLTLLQSVIEKIANGEELVEHFRDHALKGKYVGCRECHISPDWLLIYEINDNKLILILTRTGSHSELF